MSVDSNPSERSDHGNGTHEQASEELQASQFRPVASIDDLNRYRADVWESDEELEAFLEHVRSSRNADLA